MPRFALRRRLFAMSLAVLAGFLFVPRFARAGDDFPPLSPEDLKMTALPQQPGAAACILYRDELDDDNHNYEAVSMRIKILTEAGRDYANVHIPYLRRSFTIGAIHGRTIHADGSVVNFEGKALDQVVIKNQNVKVLVKTFTLPDVQVGSIIEYHYELRYDDRTVIAPDWDVQQDLFQRKAHFTYIPYLHDAVNLSSGELSQGISWSMQLPNGADVMKVKKNNTDAMELTMSDVPAFVEEEYMLPADNLKWAVRFYYAGKLQARDYWKNAGNNWNKSVEHFIGKKGPLEAAVGGIVTASDSPEQKARKIYAFVGGLQNWSYLPERSSAEQKALQMKDNHSAEDVLRQKGGDHEDLNRLFIGLARAAGLKAWAIRVPNQENRFFLDTFLDWNRQLPGEISMVELDGKEVFVDPGTAMMPFGALDWRHAHAYGMRQSPSGVDEIATPSVNYEQALIERGAKFSLSMDGRLEGTLTATYHGIEAAQRRRNAARTDEAGRVKELEDEAKTWLPANAEITLTGTPKWTDVEAPLVAEFTVKSPAVTGAGRRMLLPADLMAFNNPPWFKETTRDTAIFFRHALNLRDEIHMTLPDGLAVERLPAPREMQMKNALYQRQCQQASGELTAKRIFMQGFFAVPADQYQPIKDFFDRMKAADDDQIILRSATNAASN